MSKEYYKKQIIDLRASITKEREAKKKDNEYYARLIKGTSSTDTKARYRRSKVDKAASHDRAIESLKKRISSAQDSLRFVLSFFLIRVYFFLNRSLSSL